MSVAISGPVRRTMERSIALTWQVAIHDVPHVLAWDSSSGDIWLRYPTDEVDWSRPVRLGPQWSPQRSALEAHAAVEEWAEAQKGGDAGYSN